MVVRSGADCANTVVKLLAFIFIIYGVSLMFVYNTRALDVKLAKEPRVVSDGMKYVLQWSDKTLAPFNFLGEGNSAFVKNKCKHTNCFVTDDRSLLNLTDFDAIVFNGRTVIDMDPAQLPRYRSPKQKYVFVATESADRFPACNKVLDNFFNWTWTYKLSSDLRFGYITIYDLAGNVVGPAVDMKWPETLEPTSEDLMEKLSNKSKAAAWFVSHCRTNSKRENFVARVNKELQLFDWNVDIYGACGDNKCPKSKWRECDKLVEKYYFFYFSFENSFAEDYVTEKLLTGLNNYAVPVVYGGAEYSRFLPAGSYLDARKLGPRNLARVINVLIRKERKRYYDYFRWRNHFTFAQTLGNEDVCKLCDALNDEQMVNTVSSWRNFRRWWNGATHTDNCM